MDFGFKDQQEQLRTSAREVLSERSQPSVYRRALEKSKAGTDEKLWKTVTELGWPGVSIDEQYGGLGLGLVDLCILMEELGRAIAPIPFFSTVAFAAQLVDQVEDGGKAREMFLRMVAAGEIRATVALGQTDNRYDAAGVSVKAQRTDSGTWKLAGTANLVPEAHLADRIIVVARTQRAKHPEEGLSLFIVPATALRSKPKPQPSIDGGRRVADVKLSGVELPDDALLGTEGGAGVVLGRALDRTAVLLAAEAVGVATKVLEMSTAYARERTQFDRPIGSFQAISHRLADMLLVTESARSHLYYAAWALDEGTPDAHRAAAAAKASASDAVRIAVNDSIQVHGGIGFTWEHDLHLFYRRAKFCELFLGDACHWRERVAAALAAS